MNDVKVGTFTGDGANVDVAIGFIPSCVMLVNPTAADSGTYVLGGAQLETVADVAASCAGDVIAYGDVDGDAAQGFTIINGAALNVDTVEITYIAYR
jgi:hypothetical protein